MAVSRMKLLNIVGHTDRFEDVVRKCLYEHDFHPENSVAYLGSSGSFSSFNEPSPFQAPVQQLHEILSYCAFKEQAQLYAPDQFTLDADQALARCKQLYTAFTTAREEIEQLKAQLEKKKELVTQLSPFTTLELEFSDLMELDLLTLRFGRMSRSNYEKVQAYEESYPNLLFLTAREEEEQVWGVFLVSASGISHLDELMGLFHFEPTNIPADLKGTPREVVAGLEGEIQALTQRQTQLRKRFDADMKDQRQELQLLYQQLRFLDQIFELRRSAAYYEKDFYLLGWVPEEQLEAVLACFDAFPGVDCIVEGAAENPHIKPPTKLKNNRLVRPFELFVKMYGLPEYNEYDPTPLVAWSYVLMFGVMFGDLGQGAVLVIVGYLAWKLKKMALGRIISLAGVSSMLFGLLYGSVFGYEDILPGFKVMETPENINIALIGSIVIGVLFVLISMGINVYNGIRQKDIKKVIFSPNGFAGIFFYLSVIIAAVLLLVWQVNVLNPVFILIFLVLPLALLFLAPVITGKLEKRKKIIEGSKATFFLENFFHLFETLLAYITNTVSFIRLGALSLAHVGMMMVVFILSTMSGASQNIAVVVVGNLFVIGMEGLVVGIQVLRLEFYELFSRFFSGSGKPFRSIKMLYQQQND